MLTMITLPSSWLVYLLVCILVVLFVKLYPLLIIYYRQCYHLKRLQFLPYHWLLGNLPVVSSSRYIQIYLPLVMYARNSLTRHSIVTIRVGVTLQVHNVEDHVSYVAILIIQLI